MNTFLKLTIVPIFMACFIRWIVANLTQTGFADVWNFREWELWLFGISIALAALWVWHMFLRLKCPNCNSYSVRHLGTEELNQFHKIKKVREQDNNGNSVTRHLNVTVAELRDRKMCGDCSYK